MYFIFHRQWKMTQCKWKSVFVSSLNTFVNYSRRQQVSTHFVSPWRFAVELLFGFCASDFVNFFVALLFASHHSTQLLVYWEREAKECLLHAIQLGQHSANAKWSVCNFTLEYIESVCIVRGAKRKNTQWCIKWMIDTSNGARPLCHHSWILLCIH